MDDLNVTGAQFDAVVAERDEALAVVRLWKNRCEQKDAVIGALDAEASLLRGFYDTTNRALRSTQDALLSCQARAEAAEATVERLRQELAVCHDLLRGVPEHSAAWYSDICDYLETLRDD